MSTGAMAEEVAGGVSLGRYAAVQAALAEELALADILAAEGLEQGAWAEANTAWTLRVASEPDTFAAYTRALADAEDRLSRKVTPIDTDVAAWVSFLAAWKPDVRAETMKKTGLRMTDVSRLVRHWDRRAQNEPEVKKRLAELRAGIEKAKGAELPAIHVEPGKLTPQRLAQRPAAPDPVAAPAKTDTGGEELGLDLYAAVVAELQAEHAERADVLARHGLSQEAFEPIERSWNERFQKDATARLDFGRLVAHQRAKRREAVASGAPEVHPPERHAPAFTVEQYASLGTELDFWPDRAGEILARYGLDEATKAEVDAHFRARVAVDPTVYEAWRRASQAYAAWLTQARGGTAAPGDVAGTADISAFVPREALPFTHAEGAPPPLAARPSAPHAEPTEPRAGTGTEDITSLVPREALPFPRAASAPEAAGTADITSFVPREALPFHPQAHPAVPVATAQAAPHAPPAGSGTEDITSFVPRAAFPFVRRAGPEGMVAAATPVTRPELPAAPAGSGTEDITSFVPRGALPFSQPAGAVAPMATPAHAAPPAGSGTEDITAFVPRAPVPFAQPAAAAPQDAAAAHPRMRLIRFDPQTGQPLAEPRWVEMPSEPPGKR